MSYFDFIERLEPDDLLRADMEFFVENLAQALRDKVDEIERLKREYASLVNEWNEADELKLEERSIVERNAGLMSKNVELRKENEKLRAVLNDPVRLRKHIERQIEALETDDE
jgi:regulator of replication initiation timing